MEETPKKKNEREKIKKERLGFKSVAFFSFFFK